MLIWFLPAFLIFLMIGLPVFFALLASPGILLWMNGQTNDITLLYRNVYNGMDSFPLMAIPFFMLAGELMNRGGITIRLVEFSQALMGHLRGGLAHVNVLSSILFAGLSGSAVADTSALGSMLIPAMEKQGYTRKFAAAITAASSVIGPIIPPSGIMIIYAYVMGESVAALFLAGIVPGIMVGVGLMFMIKFMADKYDFPVASRKYTWGERRQASLKAFFPLLTPVIILGGILGGIFTPTEAAAVAVGYAFIIGFFVLRTLTLKEVPEILSNAGSDLGRRPAAGGRCDGVQNRGQPQPRTGTTGAADPQPVGQPADPAVADQPAAVHCRHVPGCGPRDHHPGSDPGPDLYQPRRRPDPFRHYHERQPDRGPGHTAHGVGAVRGRRRIPAKRSKPSPRQSCRFWRSKSS